MNEWVLLIALNIIGSPGDLRDVSLSTIGGFSNKTACEQAAEKIAGRSVALVGRARIQRGIQGNSNVSIPSINTECVQITK